MTQERRAEEYPDPVRFYDAAARFILHNLTGRIETGGRFSMLLSGGRTPLPLYEILAGMDDIRWDLVDIFWGDERLVPRDHPESNAGAARQLVEAILAGGGGVHPIRGDAVDPAIEAKRYTKLIHRMCGAAPSLALLGLGSDGHTASLFPGEPEVDDRRSAYTVTHREHGGRRRITATFPLINSAGDRLMLVRGASKAKSLAAFTADTGDSACCPARLLAPTTIFFQGVVL